MKKHTLKFLTALVIAPLMVVEILNRILRKTVRLTLLSD
jgi:hypothetical protein